MNIKHAARGAVLASITAAAFTFPAVATSSPTSNGQSPLYRSDAADCHGTRTLVRPTGNVTAHRNPNGTVTVNIVIRNGTPNTTYLPNIYCFAFIGEIRTNRAGTGTGHFVLGQDTPSSFSVSVYAPASGDSATTVDLNIG